MSFVQFVVRQRKGTWSVTSADLDRSFAARATALKAAIELANESGKNGKPAIVCAEGDGGQFEAIWTYGTDLYPPTGLGHLRKRRPDSRLR
jgi:hypothetical protein